MRPDTEIIQECLHGSQLAYKQLYERYLPYCYGICSRYGIFQSDMKDVVQVIFTQVFHALSNFDKDRAQFKTWFTRVSVNNILNYKRKQTKNMEIQHLGDSTALDNHLISNEINEDIDRQHILALLKKMPTNYQLVFNMFIIDGYTHEEIAEALNISIASSRVTLNRARGWVKKTFISQLNSSYGK